jgi:maltose alpha-D-glucosyltransferase/alpha-amylase
MLFNFFVNQHVFYALATGDVRPLASALAKTRVAAGAVCQWGHFLRNHDELDLGRLTRAQRARVFTAFAPEPRMQLYDRGIRRRLAPMLDGDRRRIELAYSLMFTLPGTPVIRYGDEIGMGDDLRLRERDAARTPMQWSTEPHAGFTAGEAPVLPTIAKGAYAWDRVNAAQQRRDPNSLLNWTERIVRMRKECPEFGWGEWKVLGTGSHAVLALRYEWRGNAVVAVHNFDGRPRSATLEPGGRGSTRLVNLLAEDHSTADRRGRHRVELEAYGYRWYRVGGLSYILERERA